MGNYFRIVAIILGTIFVIPLILGSLVVIISRQNKRYSIVLGGLYGQIIGGGIGVIIHELSHLIIAVLFGHYIQNFRLLRIPDFNNPQDNNLGYVSHAWNDESLYQKIGNVFIGIAPVIGCSLAMVLLTRWMEPSIYNRWMGGSIVINEHPWWFTVVWLILITNISIGGFDLSAADLQNSRHGIITLLILVLIIAGILTVFTPVETIYQHLFLFMKPFYWVLGFALFINIAIWVIMAIIVHFR